ncbi:MAG: hypothetical protein ACK4M7_03800 [Burkholderiales bacterium]
MAHRKLLLLLVGEISIQARINPPTRSQDHGNVARIRFKARAKYGKIMRS